MTGVNGIKCMSIPPLVINKMRNRCYDVIHFATVREV